MIEVQRNGERLALPIRPVKRNEPGHEPYWALGIRPSRAATRLRRALRYGPLRAVPAAFAETGRLFGDSVAMIARMFDGCASVQNVSGPITIARYANASAQLGPAWFLNFLALLSLSLAIINLLPIPRLGRGHLLYYLYRIGQGQPAQRARHGRRPIPRPRRAGGVDGPGVLQ